MTEKFLVVFESGPTSYGAMSPEIPGCFAVGQTLEEVRTRFIEAAESHLAWLAGKDEQIPHPQKTTLDISADEPEESSTYILERLALRTPEPAHA